MTVHAVHRDVQPSAEEPPRRGDGTVDGRLPLDVDGVTDTFGDFIPELDVDAMQTTFDTYVDLGIAKADPAPTTDELVVTP